MEKCLRDRSMHGHAVHDAVSVDGFTRTPVAQKRISGFSGSGELDHFVLSGVMQDVTVIRQIPTSRRSKRFEELQFPYAEHVHGEEGRGKSIQAALDRLGKKPLGK